MDCIDEVIVRKVIAEDRQSEQSLGSLAAGNKKGSERSNIQTFLSALIPWRGCVCSIPKGTPSQHFRHNRLEQPPLRIHYEKALTQIRSLNTLNSFSWTSKKTHSSLSTTKCTLGQENKDFEKIVGITRTFLFYLPQYSLHLNIAETLWRVMKTNGSGRITCK